MLTKIEIENFKSIYKESIELGRVNVFIGENGCGKTNILEAVGMFAAHQEWKMSNDELFLRGIRVTKPSLTFSSFSGKEQQKEVKIATTFRFTDGAEKRYENVLTVSNPDDIFSQWLDKRYDLNNEQEFISARPNGGNDPLATSYKIFHLSTDILRGIGSISHSIPGINGENLDYLIASLSEDEFQEVFDHAHLVVPWLEEIIIDREGALHLQGHNLNLSQSKLYFRDKFMAKKNNIFSAENANEGILHILFYLALFISKRTPKFFAIDNIETALNPHLCRTLMVELVKLAKKKENGKQVLITTHNPAILDGLNLHDDEQRLFIVERDFKGHTRVERLKIKPDAEVDGQRLKLSELWMRGLLGAVPQHF